MTVYLTFNDLALLVVLHSAIFLNLTKYFRPCTDVSAASSRNLSPIEEGESAKVELDEEGQEVTDNTLIHALLGAYFQKNYKPEKKLNAFFISL